MFKTDVLIIGSGISGLSFALKLAEKRIDLDITIVTKGIADDCNTKWAQGGIATVTDFSNDSIEKHIEDTIKSGGGYSDRDIVKMVVENAPHRIKELEKWGVLFDRLQNGSMDLNLEGGHSEKRILHCKDLTGLEIEKILLRRVSEHPNIHIYQHLFALDLILDQGQLVKKNQRDLRCGGAILFDGFNRKTISAIAKITLLSTGGIGQIYRRTTNPEVASGDGVAMAYRAGASVRDMHFVQFHPTAFYFPGDEPCFLISEAVRGFGAFLVNKREERFILKYDHRGELATRDIVSSAIETELSTSGETHVFIDCRHLDFKIFSSQFPSISNYCLEKGIHFKKDLIPVAPAAHYQCGGIQVNQNSETNISNLLAVGECASTGLHGTNRLASNSLLEALVFSHNAYLQVNAIVDDIQHINYDSTKNTHFVTHYSYPADISSFRNDLRNIMSIKAGINRTKKSLLQALDKVKTINNIINLYYTENNYTVPLLELRNMSCVALIILDHAIKEKYIEKSGLNPSHPFPSKSVLNPI